MKYFNEGGDTECLKLQLTSIEESLTPSFIERRSRLRNHKSTILEELQDVVIELNKREHDLKQAVSMGLMLINTNDMIQQKTQKMKEKLKFSQEKSHHQAIEIKDLKESLDSEMTRNEQLNKTLLETEEKMLEISAELSRLRQERFQGPISSPDTEEIEHLRENYRLSIDSIQKTQWELEKENKKLHESKFSCETQISDLKSGNRALENKVSKLSDSLKEYEMNSKNYINEIQKLESQLNVSNSNYHRLKLHADRLEEELSIIDVSSNREQAFMTHALSLQSELQYIIDGPDDDCDSLKDEDKFDYSFIKHKQTLSQASSKRNLSISYYSKFFSTSSGDSIDISPCRTKRKNPPEEYFLLTAQAVKMNSPHIDILCTLSTSDLYKQAVREGIPFHKWHIWIESQLNVAYVQQIYKKSTKNIWKRYKDKFSSRVN